MTLRTCSKSSLISPAPFAGSYLNLLNRDSTRGSPAVYRRGVDRDSQFQGNEGVHGSSHGFVAGFDDGSFGGAVVWDDERADIGRVEMLAGSACRLKVDILSVNVSTCSQPGREKYLQVFDRRQRLEDNTWTATTALHDARRQDLGWHIKVVVAASPSDSLQYTACSHDIVPHFQRLRQRRQEP